MNLDTNSGIISRLTKSVPTWTKVDIVRGLPRSEENRASNGMQLDAQSNTLYLAQGGSTNAGSPSINFAYASETALAAAVPSIDLNALDAMPMTTDPYGRNYLYDLPTLNDPNRSRAKYSDGSNVNDPFGGNDGLNQAKLVPGRPVQVYAPGFRNAYDLVLTRAPGREGRMYTFDNRANQGWGGYRKNEGPGGTVTNEYVEGEPGSVTLSWAAATDNTGVTGCRISRNRVVQTTESSLTYIDPGISAATSYSYSVLAVDAAGNVSPATTGTIATASGANNPNTIRVNAGGGVFVDGSGQTWAADPGFNTGQTSSTTATVTGTTVATLYKTERYQPVTDPQLSYTFALPNSCYVVRLLLAETNSINAAVGKRIFDIDIRSVRACEDVDIYALAGANTALVLEKPTAVTDEQLKISFGRQVENPKINAIEIFPDTSPTDTQPPGQPGALTFSKVSATGVTVSWSSATDNDGMIGYRISRVTTTLATVTGLNYADSGLTAGTSYTYSVFALDAAGNSSSARTGTIATTAGGTSSAIVRVNAGGPSYKSNGETWWADTGFTAGSVGTTTTTFTNTADSTLFRTERYATSSFAYALPVANGNYNVRLHFAETYSSAKVVGKRIFDINIEEARAFDNVDIFALAGAEDKAFVLEKPTAVADGQINISFMKQLQNPKINAIEVIPTP